MSLPVGLREQKKARTRADLVDAAYALVTEQGMAGVTAEAVAARAGVSRRTFFNYFPSVESVLTAGVGDFFLALGDRLQECPPDEAVLDSVERLVAAPTDPALFERIGVMGVVGLGSAQARAVIQGFLHDWLGWLTAHLRERLPADTEDLYVVNLATAFVAVSEAALYVWADRTGGTLSARSVAELQAIFAESVRYLRTGFDRPATTPHPTRSED
ncbi:MAG TPA: TetR family transcriptional regulator [Nocardioides sp.]|uniref:TetR family transcriptional regulator n=1 Tax=Nocardioides sp. TaxID=35761 RepID=UPI002C8833D8|nr:TetR family transcriptional regulator [Nocardioides sp.]HQR27939.1 TetR family transcriptional regulator [Nocardioides sp.]